MARQKFDELNSTYKKYAEKWFDKMDITAGDKKRRVQLCLDYCEIIIMLFEMLEDGESRDNLYKFAEERFNIIADNYVGQEDLTYINDWSKQEAERIVDKTLEKYEEVKNLSPVKYEVVKDENGNTYTIKPKEYSFEDFGVTVPESEYWTSNIRGLLLGIECAIAVSNYYELYDALEKGKTHKVWRTEGDDRVRATHTEVDGADIPITDLFQVGDSYLLFPGDISNGASEQEVCNCRCTLEFY